MTQHSGSGIDPRPTDATVEYPGQAHRNPGEDARQALRETADQAQRKTAEYARQARDRGMQMLDEQKHGAASHLHTVGEAIHRAAGKFREERDDNLAGYTEALADEVDRLAGYLERRDLPQMVRDCQHMARQRPELFLGGMFVAGLALTRFLKASRRGDYPGSASQDVPRATPLPAVSALEPADLPVAAPRDFTEPGGDPGPSCSI